MDNYGLTLVIFFCLFSFLVTHRFEAVILDSQAIKKVDPGEQERGEVCTLSNHDRPELMIV